MRKIFIFIFFCYSQIVFSQTLIVAPSKTSTTDLVPLSDDSLLSACSGAQGSSFVGFGVVADYFVSCSGRHQRLVEGVAHYRYNVRYCSATYDGYSVTGYDSFSGMCQYGTVSSSSSSAPPPPPNCEAKGGQTANVSYSFLTGAPRCELNCDGNVTGEICIGDTCTATFTWSGLDCDTGDGDDGSASSSSSSSSGSGGDGGDDGGDDGSGGGGSSSSGGGSDNPQNCPAGTGWGTIGGISDCWGGYDEYPQYDCPPGLVGGMVNDVYVCHKLHDYSCPAGQTWGSINGTYACHGTTPEPCTGGQTWGSVNGVVGCHGQPVNSCPEGQFFGTVNGLSGCWGSPSCPTGFTHGSVNGVVGCYSNAGCDSLGNCSKPPTGGSSSSASSSGSGGDGDGDGGNGGDGDGGNGSGSGSSASGGSSSKAAGHCDPTNKNYAVCIGQVGAAPDGFAGEITQTFDTAGRGKIDENISNYLDDIENYSGIDGEFQNAPNALESAIKAYLPSASSCTPIQLKFLNHTDHIDCGFFSDFRLIFGWFLTACAAVYIWSFSTAPINR